MIPVGVLFGIVAMIGFGASDIFAAPLCKKEGTFRTNLWVSSGIALLQIIAAFFIVDSLIFNSKILWILLAASISFVVAALAYYKGIEKGELSIMSPISASGSMITIILSMIFLSEAVSGLNGGGIIAIIIGTILVSFKYKDLIKLNIKKAAQGVEFALLSMFSFGVMFFFLAILVDEAGWYLPSLYINVAAAIIFFVMNIIKRQKLSIDKSGLSKVFFAALCSFIAFMGAGYGMEGSLASVVTPVAFAYPLVTIVLARIFFKEKLELNQYFGILLTIGGIILLSL